MGHIRGLLADPRIHGQEYRKTWARLRHQSIRTSVERVRQRIRQHGLSAPHHMGCPHEPWAHDGTL